MLPNSGDQVVATVLLGLEGIGVLAFAISGVLAAVRKRLDVVGVVIIAFLTALGGGTLRDVLLDRSPFFWVAFEGWVWAIIAIGVIGAVVLRSQHFDLTERAIQWPDALGLGLFAASGTQIALDLGQSPLVATLMGVVTAAFGGMIRDILVNEVPWVVASYQLYAIIAFTGGWLVWALNFWGAPPTLAVSIGAAAITATRILAITFNWHLPNWRRDDPTGAIPIS